MATSQMAVLIMALCFFLVLHEKFQLQVCSGGGWVRVDGKETIDCPSACDYRCSKASRHEMCIRACNTCCKSCHCVPPGTSGDEDTCPCYANMTTHGGRHKCP